ncbi:FliM/FliN family flagellar motor switch protein [Rhodovulum sp. DZ06]|uniref:FliM/FliN family flagellar motor switch protein n=1 Tax=Rhodovulum sp. DZ06 TaxID=3425126 RepID=UPI003D32D422
MLFRLKRMATKAVKDAPEQKHEDHARMAQTENALARKISGARVGRAPIPRVEEIGENFAKIVDEKVRPLLRTIVGAIVIDCEVRKLSRVLEDIPVPAMIGVIKVKGSKNMALINVGTDLIFHIVDLRMGGDPAQAPMPTMRSITAIDCALCADFINAVLQAFEGSLALNLGPIPRGAMRLDHFEQHVTMVRIAPEHSDVLVLRLSLDVGEAARSGEFDLVLPLSVLDAYQAGVDPAAQAAAEAKEEQGDLWTARMSKAARQAPAQLRAVLHRADMSVSELSALQPGDVIPLPEGSRGRVEIVFEKSEDQTAFAVGRLGAFEGRKAVKLTEAPDAALVENIRNLTDRNGGAG